jgi:uncharacterized protein YcfJ
MKLLLKVLPLIALGTLAGCVTVPYEGPSTAAMPGTGKSIDQFRADDMDCRAYARQDAGTPAQAAADSGVASAALGTLIGAAAGAAFNGSHGAAVGAGTGLLFGSLAGTDAAHASAHIVQRRYDGAYHQCMYARGNRVPLASGYAPDPRRGLYPPSPYPPSPPPAYYPY